MSLYSIASLDSESYLNWQVRHVQVTSKSILRQRGHGSCFSLQIEDDSGAMLAIYAGMNADIYHRWIQVGHVYNISGGRLRNTKRSNSNRRRFVMVLNEQSKITLVQQVACPPRVRNTLSPTQIEKNLSRPLSLQQRGNDEESSVWLFPASSMASCN